LIKEVRHRRKRRGRKREKKGKKKEIGTEEQLEGKTNRERRS
jgi:hypothetical protein